MAGGTGGLKTGAGNVGHQLNKYDVGYESVDYDDIDEKINAPESWNGTERKGCEKKGREGMGRDGEGWETN